MRPSCCGYGIELFEAQAWMVIESPTHVTRTGALAMSAGQALFMCGTGALTGHPWESQA
jgi:hypothetical protein